METEGTITEQSQLAIIVEKSGIEKSKAEEITGGYIPFLQTIADISEQSKKIDFENPSELDEKIARELRLQLVPNRTAADKFKAAEKANYLLINGIHDGAYKIVENTSKLLENKLAAVEKQREIKEKARKEELRLARLAAIKDLVEDATIYPLSEMTETAFDDLKNTLELQAENKRAMAEKAEAERIAKEKAEAEEREKMRIENERLKAEAEEHERLLAEERAKAEAEKRELEEKARKEREAAEAEAARIKAEQGAKLEAERKERERVEAELKAKRDAEAKAKADEEARIEAERKAKAAEEKKARLAPDKQKIKQVAMQLKVVEDSLPSVKSEEANAIVLNIRQLIQKTIEYTNQQSEKL